MPALEVGGKNLQHIHVIVNYVHRGEKSSLLLHIISCVQKQSRYSTHL